MKKNYILDTNILIEDPKCIETLRNGEENDIIIPHSVLLELDKLKRESKVRHCVFAAIAEIEKNFDYIIFKADDDDELQYNHPDINIISEAKNIIEKIKTENKSIIISNDRMFRLFSKIRGIESEEFRVSHPIKSESENFTGVIKKEDIEELNVKNFFAWENGKPSYYKNGEFFKTLDYVNDAYGIKPKHIGAKSNKKVDQYQNMAMELLLDNDIELMTMQGEAGSGKAQPLHSNILTPNGWKKMGEIREGDKVITYDGTETTVLAVFPQGKKNIYKITTTDGGSTEACLDHLWTVRNSRDQRWKTMSTKELMENSLNDRSWALPVVAPVQYYKNNSLEDDPYTLGMLLGDGCLVQLPYKITSIDSEIQEYIPYETKEFKYGERIPFYSIYNLKIEEMHGLKSNEKFIPEEYMYSSVEDRKNLLAGLLDADGTINQGLVSFTSVSEKMANQVRNLVWSLGGRASISSRMPFFRDKNKVKRKGQKVYTIFIAVDFNPFKIKRKYDKWENCIRKPVYRGIKNIEYVGEAECQCILVDSDTSLYVTDDFIVTHNTFITIAAGLSKMLSQERKYERIIIIKPNIEIGESMGFLPGDIDEKMAPYFEYLNFLLDKINELSNRKVSNRIFNNGKNSKNGFKDDKIKMIPLNFLRGITIENSFVIIDEAQNISRSHMRTILSRMGHGTKVVALGDTNQVDNIYLNKFNNGLNWIVQLMKQESIYAHIVLKGGQTRGPICDAINRVGL